MRSIRQMQRNEEESPRLFSVRHLGGSHVIHYGIVAPSDSL